MICSACRQARQLAAFGRRATHTSVPMTSTAISTTPTPTASMAFRRGLATSVPAARTTTARTLAARPFSHSALRPSAASSSSPASTDSAPAAAQSTAPPKPDFLDEAESHVWDLLVEAFEPLELSVRDISGGCGSMYGIEISSERFRGANMLKQQRMVNAALGDLVKGWHGVQLKTRAP